MIVRHETPHDFSAIREINLAAFRGHPFSRQTEHLIVEALRDAGALELSLVGRTLVEAGLEALRARGAGGFVLVGDPAFYDRFGFRHFPGVTSAGVPDEYVLCLPVGEAVSGRGMAPSCLFRRGMSLSGK